jgi:phospholipid/cholesterol/gamma-HCH transport system permease protein
MRRLAETVGRVTLEGITEIGLGAVLFLESLFWLTAGPARGQPVRLGAALQQAMEIGIRGLPIVTALSLAVGMMVAIQGIYSLSVFGAESKVSIGIALSVTREFAPLITSILVAGRSGSSLAARIGSMKINEEISALNVMGINPVRYLAAPALVAMVIMVPALTWYADVVGLAGAGIYVVADLGISPGAYISELQAACGVNDVMHGIGKSVLFGVIIAMVGVVNGSQATGGAEGIGRATTRSVVNAISAIVITDMFFAFAVTRT